MTDRDDEPRDLFDAVCRLDDLADWLREHWPEEADELDATCSKLKGYVVLTLKQP